MRANNFKDRTGDEYGDLRVLKFWGTDKNNNSVWLCVCECGTFKRIIGGSLNSGLSKSCGCKVIEKAKGRFVTHGLSHRLEYNSWRGMRERCDNPKNTHYHLYGARGITYPEAWKDFAVFFADMGECPKDFQLDRTNVNKNYSKENCKWVDKNFQAYNIRKKTNNTSGRTGVYQRPNGKWYAIITYYKKVITFSYCDSFEDACIVREFAELALYGFIKE